ncbi:MAG: response regulator [Planctomycetota bacterium]
MARRGNILIVDDQPVTRLGLETLIERQPGLRVVDVESNTADGYDAVRRHKPDLVILDIAVEGDRGIEFIQNTSNMTHVLVFSLREETLYAERCLQAGAKGYISKRESEETVIAAINSVIAGKTFVGERVKQRLVERALNNHHTVNHARVQELTDRELEIFELLGQGVTTREIADKLCISVKTVQGYHASIKDTFDLPNMNQLIRRAVHYVLEGT